MKRILLLVVLLMFVLGTSCFADSKITCSSDEDSFVQYYATESWCNSGIYQIEARITKHIQESGEITYWLNVNARGRDDGFTTKAQIVIGEKTYSLKCVDLIGSKYRSSMTNRSRAMGTECQEFYDVDAEVINEISLTTKPVYIAVNFKNRPNIKLKAEGGFVESLKAFPSLTFQNKEKYLNK